MATRKIQAAMLSLALLLPAGGAFAKTHRVRTHRYYTTTHRHHYSQTRGALVGAAAGAALMHNHVKGALIGAAVGTGVLYERNKHEKNKH